MLSERVIEEFTREGTFSDQLVRLAWPSLSVESKLQVIDAVQRSRYTPEWLMRLALDDVHAVVRYWAARYYSFNNKGPEHYHEILKDWAATPDDMALAATASKDACELVRMRVPKEERTSLENLHSVPQLERLAYLRNTSRESLESFVDFLNRGLDAGLSDRELAECAREFFAHPETVRELSQPYGFDGMEDHGRATGMREGWAVVKKCGVALSNVLAYHLPTKFGMGTMKAEELAQLPDRPLRSLLLRDETPEVAELIDLMRKRPASFSKDVQDALERRDEYPPPIASKERERLRASNAPQKQQATLDAVLSLQQEVGELREELRSIAKEAASRKRGLFG